MSALTPPAAVRITPDARQLFRSFLIEDERLDVISSNEYLTLDKALAENAIFHTQEPQIESPAHGKHYCLELNTQTSVLRFPYYVRFDYLTAA